MTPYDDYCTLMRAQFVLRQLRYGETQDLVLDVLDALWEQLTPQERDQAMALARELDAATRAEELREESKP